MKLSENKIVGGVILAVCASVAVSTVTAAFGGFLMLRDISTAQQGIIKTQADIVLILKERGQWMEGSNLVHSRMARTDRLLACEISEIKGENCNISELLKEGG